MELGAVSEVELGEMAGNALLQFEEVGAIALGREFVGWVVESEQPPMVTSSVDCPAEKRDIRAINKLYQAFIRFPLFRPIIH